MEAIQSLQNLSPAALAELWRSAWVEGLIGSVVWIVGMLFVQAWLMRVFRRFAARTAWEWDDILVGAFAWPVRIAIVASGVMVLERALPLEREWDRACDVMLASCIALALVLFLDRIAKGFLDRLAQRNAALQGAMGLAQGAVRGSLIAIGLLIVLDSVGISIKPLLASLGVGSLAVAFGLRETIADFFAGLNLITDRQLEAGHFIRLDSGEEGHVVRVGWRSTWLRTPQNNMMVIPNNKLGSAIITITDLPSKALTITVHALAPLDADLDKVERLAMDVARAAQQEMPDPSSDEPVIRFVGFADSGVKMQVVLNASTLKSSQEVRHVFLKRLMERFRREGVAVPYPARTLYFASPGYGGSGEDFPTGHHEIPPGPERSDAP
jgi:small-conductance mechanosensitive channel